MVLQSIYEPVDGGNEERLGEKEREEKERRGEKGTYICPIAPPPLNNMNLRLVQGRTYAGYFLTSSALMIWECFLNGLPYSLLHDAVELLDIKHHTSH